MSTEIDICKTLLYGTNLIEANAGTGKTYTITALFTRMIVEKHWEIQELLVVTFTNAAVSDLKSKIYQRLCDVRDCLKAVSCGQEPKSEDPFPMEYALIRSDTAEEDLKHISWAIRDFDKCSIFTIHSFCQRMLKENAFSGNVAYDVEMTGDSKKIIKKPVYDFWRKNVYKAPQEAIPAFLKTGPDSLVDFYKDVSGSQSIKINKPDNDISIEELVSISGQAEKLFKQMSAEWEICRKDISQLLNPERADFPLNKKSYSVSAMEKTLDELENCILADSHLPADRKNLKRLTSTEIQSKLKKGCSLEHPFFLIFEKWFSKAEEYYDSAEIFTDNIKFRLFEYMDEYLEKYKNKKDIQTYDDLISRMRNSVCSPDAQMKQSLQKNYKAALIDEFQDTDPYQYDIFSRVFSGGERPFFMIGDPKQAIYSFRGADVFAYLKAAEGDKYTLTKNHRSDSALVEALNTFFKNDNAFILKDISYNPSVSSEKDMKLKVNNTIHPPVQIWNADGQSAEQTAKSTARHIASLLNMSASGNAFLGNEPVRPSDIAVLCRSNPQLLMVKNALAKCGVPAVVSGSESVFAGEEALETASFLAAVISPFNERLVKTALASNLFGYQAEELYRLTETDLWDRITEEFRMYNELINSRGIAPMFFKMAADRNLYTHMASLPSGERKLTNHIHIIELLQKYEAEKNAAPQDLLTYLKEKIETEDIRDEDSELKMDSDENAVTIITIHKSKGLEYNIVYSPFLMYENTRKDLIRYHKDGEYYLDINSEENIEISEKEKDAEKIRLAYVALTRAKSVCFTAWGKVRNHAKSALAHLINGSFSDYSPSVTTEFFKGTSVSFADMPDESVQIYQAPKDNPAVPNRNFDGEIPACWRINSFSRLIHSGSSSRDTDQFFKPAQTVQPEDIYSIFAFPKGAKAGTCLHECMEEIDFSSFSENKTSEIVADKLGNYSFDTAFVPAVTKNICDIVKTDMNGVRLSDLKSGDFLPEMEFNICTDRFESKAVSSIFEKYGETDYAKASATLNFTADSGFLNGFADLIFTQNNRFHVLDWKSNYLGAGKDLYTFEHMHAEMLSSHYYLQMYIYTLALHMHLKNTLPGYSYEKNMGCGIYVFMRGVAENPDTGIYSHKPKEKIITELEELVKRP